MIGMGSPDAQHWRMFCALEIPSQVRQNVLRHVARLKELVPDAKASWSREANLHLTLRFLGEISQPSVASLSNTATHAVSGVSPFTMSLEETGAFPKHGPPRVLWIGIKERPNQLGTLYERLENELAKAGFAKEERAFHPHLTIARLRQPAHARELAAAHRALDFEPETIEVSELLVIRSELSSVGSNYSVISRHPF